MNSRKTLSLATIFCVFVIANSAVGGMADFDDLSLGAGSYWNGSDSSGGFTSGSVSFTNNYNTNYGSWDGWAYSNMTDTTTPGVDNQYSAITGSGQGGSSNYGVSFIPMDWNNGYVPIPSVMTIGDSAAGTQVSGAYFTNTTFATLTMQSGDLFSKKFGGDSGDDEDWFLLTITGKNAAGGAVGTIDLYLADFRFADSVDDYILDEWAWLDLSSFGVVKSLEFSLSSSDTGLYGMNTPGYFAMDTLIPEPATIVMLAFGGLFLRRKRNSN